MNQQQTSHEDMIGERICPKVIRHMTPEELSSGNVAEVHIRLPTKREISEGKAFWGDYVAEVWITKIFKVILNVPQRDLMIIRTAWKAEEITIDKPAVCEDCPVQYLKVINRKTHGTYYKMTVMLSHKHNKVYDYDFSPALKKFIQGEPELDSLFEMTESTWSLLQRKGEQKK